MRPQGRRYRWEPAIDSKKPLKTCIKISCQFEMTIDRKGLLKGGCLINELSRRKTRLAPDLKLLPAFFHVCPTRSIQWSPCLDGSEEKDKAPESRGQHTEW